MKKIKVGIIGAGAIARACHIPAYVSLADRCDMVAVCDVNTDAAQAEAQKHGVPRVYSCYKELLADPDVEAVSIATPNTNHFEQAVQALKAGKHVLCEKPLAMNAEQARGICRAAKESGKVLQVGFQLRFGAAAQLVKRSIDAGRFGDIYYARAQALRRRGVPGWGVFIDKEKQGGGPLIDIGIHVLDLTLFFMGHPKPVSASGMTWDKLGKDPEVTNLLGDYDRSRFTVEDFAAALIRFENGAAITVETSFMANLSGNAYQTQLFGTRAGAIVKPLDDKDPVEIFTEQDGQLVNVMPTSIPNVESNHAEEIRAFFNAIESGGESPVPGEQGLVLNAIIDAIYLSAETGKEQPIDVSY